MATLSRDDHPPPYTSLIPNTTSPPYTQDARSASSQSLGPSSISSDGRRKLLLVYIHGFMGDETSFQAFPAHVHNKVANMLRGSHTVHSKIYPRYRSKKPLAVAVNDFAAWLEPHESPETDVILFGHSMGGLLLSETVLLPNTDGERPLQHRILGTISFDTPFLGMHPGIVKAGLGSIFSGGDTAPTSPGNSRSGDVMDPNFNPPFFNDTRLPVRSAWRSAAHFVNKHSNNLMAATKQMATSYVDFGRCMADYDGLKVRYCRIRMLEDESAERRRTVVEGERAPPRIRFVNYYTASTGKPKIPKSPARGSDASQAPPLELPAAPNFAPPPPGAAIEPTLSNGSRSEKVPIIAVEEDSDDETILSDLSDLDPLEDLELDSNFDDQDYTSSHGRPPSFSQIEKHLVSESSMRGNPFGPPRPPSNASRSTQPPPFPGTSSQLDPTDFDPLNPSLPPEPTPPGPPPASDTFLRRDTYRSALSTHGQESKAYFAAVRAHQKMLMDTFLAESRARTAAYHEEIRRQSLLVGEEAKRFSAAVAEHARILSEIAQEEIRSHQQHRKLVANHRLRSTRDASTAWETTATGGASTVDTASSVGTSESGTRRPCGPLQSKGKGKERAPSSLLAGPIPKQMDKIDRKLQARQEKIERRAAHVREKMEKRNAKVQAKLVKRGIVLPDRALGNGAGPSGSSRADSASVNARSMSMASGQDSRVEEAFFEARPTPYIDDDVAAPAYDVQSAPIGESISHFNSGSNDTLASTTTASTTSLSLTPSVSADTASATAALTKPKKERTFCTLPPPDAYGSRDPTWIKILMRDVDEVGAHCGLFFSHPNIANGIGGASTGEVGNHEGWSERYEWFVRDVSERVVGWVKEMER